MPSYILCSSKNSFSAASLAHSLSSLLRSMSSCLNPFCKISSFLAKNWLSSLSLCCSLDILWFKSFISSWNCTFSCRNFSCIRSNSFVAVERRMFSRKSQAFNSCSSSVQPCTSVSSNLSIVLLHNKQTIRLQTLIATKKIVPNQHKQDNPHKPHETIRQKEHD